MSTTETAFDDMNAEAVHRDMVAAEHMAEEQLHQVNWQRRMKILRHAYESSPFYRDFYRRAGVHPEDIKSESDWEKIPVLTRELIRDHLPSLVSRTAPKRVLVLAATGGSTGVPLTVYHDRRAPVRFITRRVFDWWGLDPDAPHASVWRTVSHTWRERLGAARRKLVALAKGHEQGELRLDASNMTVGDMTRFIRRFNERRPVYVKGYAGSLHDLSLFIEKTGSRVCAPKAVWSTSAPLSPVARTSIQTVFGAPVYDQYGSCEIHWLAAECQAHGGLHVFADVRHIEVVATAHELQSSDHSGRILVTDLLNYACPLIRYENGDLGSYRSGACPCGVNLPLLNPIQGRIPDALHLPNGTLIAGGFVAAIFDDFHLSVKAFQVRQFRDYSVTLSVVPGRDPSVYHAGLKNALRILAARTQNHVPITVAEVPAIPSDRGKTRYIVSDIQP